jgi:protoporphyrinogen IX oxidase
MDKLDTLLIALHVMSNLVWIGSIASVGWLTAAASRQDDPLVGKVVAELGYRLYKVAAVPAFLASFGFGVGRFLVDPGTYMRLHWFHGKLTFALAAIALHHVIGGKARKTAGGSMQSGRSSAILVGALLVCAFGSVVFVILKTQAVP